MNAIDFNMLMIVWTIVSLGIPLCIGYVFMDLGMTKGRLEDGNGMVAEWLKNVRRMGFE